MMICQAVLYVRQYLYARQQIFHTYVTIFMYVRYKQEFHVKTDKGGGGVVSMVCVGFIQQLSIEKEIGKYYKQ